MKAFSDKNYPLTLGDNSDKVSIKIDFETQEGRGQMEIFFDEEDIDFLTARQTKIGRKIDYKKRNTWMQNNWGLKDNPFNPDTNQPTKIKKE
jgi:hypothetical protein